MLFFVLEKSTPGIHVCYYIKLQDFIPVPYSLRYTWQMHMGRPTNMIDSCSPMTHPLSKPSNCWTVFIETVISMSTDLCTSISMCERKQVLHLARGHLANCWYHGSHFAIWCKINTLHHTGLQGKSYDLLSGYKLSGWRFCVAVELV